MIMYRRTFEDRNGQTNYIVHALVMINNIAEGFSKHWVEFFVGKTIGSVEYFVLSLYRRLVI